MTRGCIAALALVATLGCSSAQPIEPARPRNQKTPEVTNPDIPESVRLTFATKCLGCHGSDGKGGPVAPNLFALPDKERRNAQQWEEYLKDPSRQGKKMPPIRATADEYAALGEWLGRLHGPL